MTVELEHDSDVFIDILLSEVNFRSNLSIYAEVFENIKVASGLGNASDTYSFLSRLSFRDGAFCPPLESELRDLDLELFHKHVHHIVYLGVDAHESSVVQWSRL